MALERIGEPEVRGLLVEGLESEADRVWFRPGSAPLAVGHGFTRKLAFRQLAADDVEAITAGEPDPGLVRLLGPFDLLLQCQDRELVVPEEKHRKELWRTIGRPGGILHGSEVVGTWRPRTKGKTLALDVDLWARTPSSAIDDQGERLAALRGVSYAGRA